MLVGVAISANAAEKVKYTQKQIDILLAYGENEEDIYDLTNEEIAAILDSRVLIYPELLDKYYSKANYSLIQQKHETEDILSKINLPSQQINYLMSQGYSPYEILQKHTSGEVLPIKDYILPFATSYSQFRRFTANQINAIESTTYVYFSPNSIPTAFSSIATSTDITAMKQNVAKSLIIGNQLYGRSDTESLSFSQCAYNLFGEVQNLTTIHEGNDYSTYEGAGIYSVSEGGKVTSIIPYKGAFAVAVYHSNYNKTVLYIHVKDVRVSTGDTIAEGQIIASQGRYINGSVNNTHTHLEIVSELRTNGNTGGYDNNISSNVYTWAEWL